MWDELLGSLEDSAELLFLEGALDVAVQLSAAADRARTRFRLARSQHTERRWQTHTAKMRQALTGTAYESIWEQASAWDIEDAIRIALSTRREVAAV
jgi:hypothetical protein